MAVGREFSSSSLAVVLLSCCLLYNEFFGIQIQKSSSKSNMCYTGIYNFEKSSNFYVVSSIRARVRHLCKVQAEGFSATRVCRYPNSLSTFNLSRLIICVDIKLNPRLDNKCATCKPAWKFPCDVCTKRVRSNQKGIMCDVFTKWFHFNCINVEIWKYLE